MGSFAKEMIFFANFVLKITKTHKYYSCEKAKHVG